ncbi:hypothetical protein C5613_30095 [Rhodococcus opacus]|uniref:Uncharacterized protein n=1 Tax=Rhodococcus opacus TaxID=37919 RepID=A0A2S8IXJ3_RHOOP|nr:hypothetical protein C5613_30095 [Rhodococcus opacus]
MQDPQVQRSEDEPGEQGVAADPEPTMHCHPVLLQVGEHALDPDPAVMGRLPGQDAVLERHPERWSNGSTIESNLGAQ